jgi:Protein of unknown function (DUF3617)
MRLHSVLPAAAFAVVVSLPQGAAAQTQAPGLWEHTFSMKGQGDEMERARAQVQQQLAAMSAEQRKKLEETMARRGVTMNAQGTAVKLCLTKEQAAKPAEPRLPGDCTLSDVQRNGSTMNYKFACIRPEQLAGEGQLTYAGEKAYSGQSSFTALVKGQPRSMTMDTAGRWLGADCGDVKPASALPGK